MDNTPEENAADQESRLTGVLMMVAWLDQERAAVKDNQRQTMDLQARIEASLVYWSKKGALLLELDRLLPAQQGADESVVTEAAAREAIQETMLQLLRLESRNNAVMGMQETLSRRWEELSSNLLALYNQVQGEPGTTQHKP